MNAVRVYVDKKKSGEHCRVIDVGPWVPDNEQPNLDKARKRATAELKADEEINSVVSINVPTHIIDGHPVI